MDHAVEFLHLRMQENKECADSPIYTVEPTFFNRTAFKFGRQLPIEKAQKIFKKVEQSPHHGKIVCSDIKDFYNVASARAEITEVYVELAGERLCFYLLGGFRSVFDKINRNSKIN